MFDCLLSRISNNLFQCIDFEKINEFDGNLKKEGYVGYAEVYLAHCKIKARNTESKSDDEIDIEVFTRLAELDSKLGTTASKQLFQILTKTTRLDIIKVGIRAFFHCIFNKILEY